MKKITVGVLTIGLALLAGCSNVKQAMVNPGRTIIKVNNDVITQKMFDDSFKQAFKSSFFGMSKLNINDPKNKFISLIIKRSSVEHLVIKDIVDEQMTKHNIKVSDDEINKKVEEIAKTVGGKDIMFTKLKENKMDKNDFLNQIKETLKMEKLINTAAPNLKVSDEDAKKFYDTYKATKFAQPETIRAEHILIAFAPGDIKSKMEASAKKSSKDDIDKSVQDQMKKAKAKAEKVYTEVSANPSKFEALAKKYSEDPSSAAKGGDLGYFSKEQMVPEFSKVAFSTTPGQISKIVQTQFGYHIIKVVDRKKGTQVPLKEVKGEIKRFLTDQKKSEVLRNMIETAKNTAKIVYVDKEYDPKTIDTELKSVPKPKNPMPMMPMQPNQAKK